MKSKSYVSPEGFMSLFTTNCVHKCSEIQKIIWLIFYPGRFYEDLSPPFTNIYFFCKDRKQRGEGNINALKSATGFSTHIETFQQNQSLVFSLITYRWRKNIPNKSAPQGRILKFVKNAIWPHSVAIFEWCHACCKTENVPLGVTSKGSSNQDGGISLASFKRINYCWRCLHNAAPWAERLLSEEAQALPEECEHSPGQAEAPQQLHFSLCLSLQVTIFGRHRVVCVGAGTSQLWKHLEYFRHDGLSIVF